MYVDSNGEQFVHTSVIVPVDIHRKAKLLNIPISQTLIEGLLMKIKETETGTRNVGFNHKIGEVLFDSKV